MYTTAVSVLCTLALTISAVSARARDLNNLVAHTTLGDFEGTFQFDLTVASSFYFHFFFLGHYNEVGVREWKGIPYAQPPVGDLRWVRLMDRLLLATNKYILLLFICHFECMEIDLHTSHLFSLPPALLLRLFLDALFLFTLI